jgi:hypothetical protein
MVTPVTRECINATKVRTFILKIRKFYQTNEKRPIQNLVSISNLNISEKQFYEISYSLRHLAKLQAAKQLSAKWRVLV